MLYLTSFFSKIVKAKIIYYDQTPKVKYSNLISFLKFLELSLLIFVFRAAWYSPILLKPDEKKSIPFVVNTKKKINFIKENFNTLTIGKFQKRKNQIILIKALKVLLKKYKLKLTVIGQVSNDEHKRNNETILKIGLTSFESSSKA